MEMRKFGSLAVFAAFVGLMVWLQFSRKGDADKELLADMKTVISDLDVYPQNATYLDELLEREHRLAFETSYTMGGRRRRARFDEAKYVEQLFGGMLADCRRRGKTEVAESLQVAIAAAAETQ